jgi:hypothetical protein
LLVACPYPAGIAVLGRVLDDRGVFASTRGMTSAGGMELVMKLGRSNGPTRVGARGHVPLFAPGGQAAHRFRKLCFDDPCIDPRAARRSVRSAWHRVLGVLARVALTAHPDNGTK